MRATDAEEQRGAANPAEDAAKAASERAALGYPPDPDADAPPPLPQKTVWWHQIDDENDEAYEVRDFSDWHATRDLRKARLHLMNNRGHDGVAALEKLRSDLLLYARSAG